MVAGQSMSLEEQIVTYKRLMEQIADLEEKKKELSRSILEHMTIKSIVEITLCEDVNVST